MKKVLVIDDHFHTHRLIQGPLGGQGWQVQSATDGEQGLSAAQAEKPDVIVLDVTMPRMDGLEVLRELKASDDTRAIPVVMLTARGEDADVAQAVREGADHYMQKPFHPAELCALLKRILGET
jgi:DNA-binding response OmpR family regulator